MIEVCNYPESEPGLPSIMKHSESNLEKYEFNLGKAPEMRCVHHEKSTMCGKCETCLLNLKLKTVKEWFARLGDHSKKRFMLGLLRRIHSVDLLRKLVYLLHPLTNKDYTYARMRTQPSLKSDLASLSDDRALDRDEVEESVYLTWDWFVKSNYWTKSNFLVSLLCDCDSHLLFILGAQVRTLLVSAEKASSAPPVYTEAGSIQSSHYSFETGEHEDLTLLSQSCADYGKITRDPFTGTEIDIEQEIINCDSGDESLTDETVESLDPAYMIISTSSKAYAGVSRYKDFIRCLPVHLAKYILSFLDKGSMNNALCVSKNWRALMEEVKMEFDVNQQLQEDVMLMQGAAAQGVNPNYAKDIDIMVPNLYPGTHDVVYTNQQVIKTNFKSEHSFETAYSGVSTRKVILEERNVYCGAYNVMVLCDTEDIHRVVHTDGSDLIALGSKDRKVRFLDTESGKEQGPVITGHAGSVRAVFLCAKRGIVFSGSYDTSIRSWSIETGQCVKIYRGHTDTVVTLEVEGDFVASGSKDKSCKVWNMQTGKCFRTFRHRHPVWAVALSEEMCISGDEAGRVKVWDIASGSLIKTLSGHLGSITAIKFDRWHIVTASRDQYALAWSSFGKHNRCLVALRHPKEVLCLEFLYLRVITGSADGRLRIWNMVTGQCCRIMRGNSRSDPILSILAIDNRITLNTHNNLLVLNFEQVELDYTLETDKVPPLVQYGSYSDAPVRSQPYPYIRAHRMRQAGASNPKILHHDKRSEDSRSVTFQMQSEVRASQIPHSAKSLSAKSIESARVVQGVPSEYGWDSRTSARSDFLKSEYGKSMSTMTGHHEASSAARSRKPPISPLRLQSSRSRTQTFSGKSQLSQPSVTIVDSKAEEEEPTEKSMQPLEIKRRVSWAFDKPLLPLTKDVTLSEVKSLLRSQIRMKAESVVPPDFIYLTVSMIQNSFKPSETNLNTDLNLREAQPASASSLKRPSSSPSKIDPRTKAPIQDLELFRPKTTEVETMSEHSDMRSVKSAKLREQKKPPPSPKTELYTTKYGITPVNLAPHASLHPKKVKSKLPQGSVIRPISAAVMEKAARAPSAKIPDSKTRPCTAPVKSHGLTGELPPSIASTLPGATAARQRPEPLSSSSAPADTKFMPILMYPKEVKLKIEELRQQRMAREQALSCHAGGMDGVGKISPYNDPLRNHTQFELRTYEQELKHIASMRQRHIDSSAKERSELEKKRRAAWKAKAQGQICPDFPPKRKALEVME